MVRHVKALAVTTAAFALLAAGSGTGFAAPVGNGAETARAAPSAGGGTIVKTRQSRFGTILATEDTRTLYLFDKEKSAKSECYGACARAWPPLYTKSAPRARGSVRAGLLGTTVRKNGRKQVTYNGNPLYTYAHEGPKQILCQNVDEFGGLWLVVGKNGRAVR